LRRVKFLKKKNSPKKYRKKNINNTKKMPEKKKWSGTDPGSHGKGEKNRPKNSKKKKKERKRLNRTS